MKNKLSTTPFYLSYIILYTCLLALPLSSALQYNDTLQYYSNGFPYTNSEDDSKDDEKEINITDHNQQLFSISDTQKDSYTIANPFVLLVGVSKYEREDDLPTVAEEMRIFYDLFKRKCGYKVESTFFDEEGNILPKQTSYNQDTMDGEWLYKEKFRRWMQKQATHLNKYSKVYDALIFIFSGHGGCDENGREFVLTSNQKPCPWQYVEWFFLENPELKRNFKGKPRLFFKLTCREFPKANGAMKLEKEIIDQSQAFTFYAVSKGYKASAKGGVRLAQFISFFFQKAIQEGKTLSFIENRLKEELRKTRYNQDNPAAGSGLVTDKIFFAQRGKKKVLNPSFPLYTEHNLPSLPHQGAYIIDREQEVAALHHRFTGKFVITWYLRKYTNLSPDRSDFANLLSLLTLFYPNCGIQIQAILGYGGLGKSTLARLYGKKYGKEEHYYQQIWWFNAEDEKSLAKSIKEVATEMGIQTNDYANSEQDMRKINKRLEKRPRWLLIFDNAFATKDSEFGSEEASDTNEYMFDLMDYLPKEMKQGHILITTRNTAIAWQDHTMYPVRLEGLTRPQVKSLLKRFHQPQSDNEKKALQKLLDLIGTQPFPLTISQIGHYIKEQKQYSAKPYQKYCTSYQNESNRIRHLKEYTLKGKKIFKNRSIVVTFNLTLAAIEKTIKSETDLDETLRILRVMSFLHPDGLDWRFFAHLRPSLKGKYFKNWHNAPEKFIEKEKAQKSVKCLRTYGILIDQGLHARTHRTIQAIMRWKIKHHKPSATSKKTKDLTPHIQEQALQLLETIQKQSPAVVEKLRFAMASHCYTLMQYIQHDKKKRIRLLRLMSQVDSQAYLRANLYLPPQAQPKKIEGKTKPLHKQVIKFINTQTTWVKSANPGLLLTGDAGTGKSTYGCYLVEKLWEKNNNKKVRAYIPLFISLPAYCAARIPEDLIEQALQSRGLNADTIKAIRYSALSGHQPWLFVFDGYDEIHSEENLFKKCKLSEKWGVRENKYIISCRTGYLDELAKNGKTKQLLFTAGDSPAKELTIAPFSADQVEEYIETFAKSEYNRYKDKGWDKNRYDQALKKIPELKAWMTTPFLLVVGLQALPRLAGKEQKAGKFTKYDIYTAFTEEWIDREVNKPQNNIDKVRLKHFCQNLGYTLWLKRKSVIEKRDATIQAFFQKRAELQSAPVRHMEQGKYQFIHPDFKLFFAAQKIVCSLSELTAKTQLATFLASLQKEYKNHPLCTIPFKQDSDIGVFVLAATEQVMNQDMIFRLMLLADSHNMLIAHTNAILLLKQISEKRLQTAWNSSLHELTEKTQLATFLTALQKEYKNHPLCTIRLNQDSDIGVFVLAATEQVMNQDMIFRLMLLADSHNMLIAHANAILLLKQISEKRLQTAWNSSLHELTEKTQLATFLTTLQKEYNNHPICTIPLNQYSDIGVFVLAAIEKVINQDMICRLVLLTGSNDTPIAHANARLLLKQVPKNSLDKLPPIVQHFVEDIVQQAQAAYTEIDEEIRKDMHLLLTWHKKDKRDHKKKNNEGEEWGKFYRKIKKKVDKIPQNLKKIERLSPILQSLKTVLSTKLASVLGVNEVFSQIRRLLQIKRSQKPHDGDNALHLACHWSSSLEIVTWLLEECEFGLETKGQFQKTPFLCAAEKGQLAIAKLLRQQGANINAKDKDGDNALHWACYSSGSVEMVTWLLDVCKLGIETKGYRQKTPFLCAAAKGQLAIAKLLKELGANLNAKDTYGYNALHLACLSGSVAMVTWLLDLCKIGLETKGYRQKTPFLCAAAKGHLAIAKLLKERGANIHAKHKARKNALHFACSSSGSEAMVTWLLDVCNIDLETKGNYKQTPFLLAAQKGRLEIAKLLRQRGANINAKDSDGDNALHLACLFSGSVEMVNWLLDVCKMSIEVKDESKRTPFICAAAKEQVEIVKLLKERGANIHAKDKDGNNALHFACLFSGSVSMTTWLLDVCKISIEVKGQYQRTPFLYAAKKGQLAIVQLLRQRGANIHATDKDGNNALHTASHSGRVAMVTWLLDVCKIGLETKGQYERTPFLYAAENGQLPIAKLLRKRGTNISAKTMNGSNALHWACYSSGSVEMVTWLLDVCKIGIETKGDGQATSFLFAAQNGQLTIAKLLKERSANLNAKNKYRRNALHGACASSGSVAMVTWLLDVCKIPIETKGQYQITPFLCATKNGQLEIAKLLKDRGANLNAKDKEGNNALHEASHSGSVEMVTWLLDVCKIGIETRGEYQMTPFLCAANNGQLAIAKLLRERSANINAKDKYGDNALHLACLGSSSVEMTTWLLDVCKIGLETKGEYQRTPFIFATKEGQLAVAKLLKERGANLHAKDKDGSNALHFACVSGSVEMVTWLLHVCHIGLESKGQNQATPFLFAAEQGQLAIAKLLKERGANIHPKDKYGNNALHYACYVSGNVDMVTWLLDLCHIGLETKGYAQRTPFLYTARIGQLELAKLLKERGANIHAKDTYGNNALHKACLFSRSEAMVTWLLDVCNIPIETKGEGQRTPFLCAANKGQLQIAKLLKERGAYINPKDKFGNNALHFACLSGSVPMITWLLNVCHIGLETKGQFQNTPFLCAVKEGQLEIAKRLQQRGANINTKDTYGNNALHVACLYSGSVEMVTWLLDVCKIDIESKRQDKRTPFLCAAQKGQIAIAKLLKKCGANIHAKDTYGNNALHKACLFSGSEAMVTWLLDVCNIPIETKGEGQRTPFLCAANKGQLQIAKVLKERGANIHETNTFGYDALYFARKYSKNEEMISYLQNLM